MFLQILFFALLLVLIPFFSMFVQTIKNLIFFVVLVVIIAINMMLLLNIEFFPIFFILIYVGAIIVSTLFLVLTFDLRIEYVKRVLSEKTLFNVTCYFFLTPIIFSIFNLPGLSLWNWRTLNEHDRVYAYHDCQTLFGMSSEFCERSFGANLPHKTLYNSIGGHVSDIAIISDNLYTTYALLFVILGVVLTLSLVAALTMIKIKGK